MSTTLKPLDAVWLMMESDETPMHVGVLAVLRKPGKAPQDYLEKWVTAMRETESSVPPWNSRLVRGRGPYVAPRLVEEQDFDLDYHFRHTALPRPGGERELGVVVSRLHSQPLDRHLPLWELHLIEGLENERFAFYLKLHHALVDNVNAIPLMLSWLTASARTRNAPPLWARPINVDVNASISNT